MTQNKHTYSFMLVGQSVNKAMLLFPSVFASFGSETAETLIRSRVSYLKLDASLLFQCLKWRF